MVISCESVAAALYGQVALPDAAIIANLITSMQQKYNPQVIER